MNKFQLIPRAALAGIILLGCAVASAQGVAPSRATAIYSASTLYDMGNQAARAGKPALAVLDYERARLLAPNDADVRANLRAVQESAGISPQPVSWLARPGQIAAPNLMYWAGMLGLALAGSAAIAYRWRVPRRKPLAAVAIIGAAITVMSIGDAVATIPMLNEAVVMQAAPASASPVVGTEPQFTVPAAEVIHIRDQHQGFLLIQDPQNREGWIPRSNVIPVIPAQERLGGTV